MTASRWKSVAASLRASLCKWRSWPLAAGLLVLFTAPFSPVFAAGTALHVTVSYGLAAENYQRAFSGRFVKLMAGRGQGLAGKELGNVTAGAVVFMDPVVSVNPRTASDLIADLTGRIASNISGMSASMVAAMRTQNAATGVLEWKQDVLLPNSQRGVLAWRMMIDSSGSARYGTPEVLPAEALTLDVVYTPLNLSAILPPSWPRYADAGLLKWRLIDKNGTARTAWVTVDAAGAFDDPESTATENVDPDAGLKCLILDRTRCGGPTDVKTLMDQQGAAGAYVAYTRRLTPLYDNVADPARPGEYLQQPRISLTVDNRELRYNGCGQNLTYRNQGAYGYTLAAHAEKYLVDASLRYYPVDWSDQVRTSPTQPYDKSVSVARADIASIGSKIISPGPVGSDLVNSGEVAGITYLAPVVQSGQGSDTKTWGWRSLVLYHAHEWYSGYKIWCNEDQGKINVKVGVVDDPNGKLNAPNYGYSPVAVFTPGVAGMADSVTWSDGDLHRPYLGPLAVTVSYDGNRTFRFTQSTRAYTGYYGEIGATIATGAANTFGYIYGNVLGTLIYADGVLCRSGERLSNEQGSSYSCVSNTPPVVNYSVWPRTGSCPSGYAFQPEQCGCEWCGCTPAACSRPALDETIVW